MKKIGRKRTLQGKHKEMCPTIEFNWYEYKQMCYDCQRDGLTQDIKRHRSSVNNDRALDDLQQ